MAKPTATTGHVGTMTYSILKSTLTLKLDLTADQGLSKSAKNRLVQTSRGRTQIAGGIALNCNCYTFPSNPVPDLDSKAWRDAVELGEHALGSNVMGAYSADGVLTLVVDLDDDFGPSKSGKNLIVASMGGNRPIASGLTLGLTIDRPVLGAK